MNKKITTLPAFPSQDNGLKYNDTVALWLAECSALAYKQSGEVIPQLKTFGFDRVSFFDSDSTSCYLAEHPGDGTRFAVVAFRGTEADDYKDILTDISIITRRMPEYECGVVHGGFLTSLNDICGTYIGQSSDDSISVSSYGTHGLWNAIAKLQEQKCRLYLTGHSLGGALATLAAYRLQRIYRITALYTLGSPRLVTKTFAEANTLLTNKIDPTEVNVVSSSRYYRIINQQDIVTQVPLMGYRHIGQARQLVEKKGKIQNVKFRRASNTPGALAVFWGLAVFLFSFMAAVEINNPGRFLKNQLIESIRFEALPPSAEICDDASARITLIRNKNTTKALDLLMEDLAPQSGELEFVAKTTKPRMKGIINLRQDSAVLDFLREHDKWQPKQEQSVLVEFELDDDLMAGQHLGHHTFKFSRDNNYITRMNLLVHLWKMSWGSAIPKYAVDNIILIAIQLALFFVPLWVILGLRQMFRRSKSSALETKVGLVRQAALLVLILFLDLAIEAKALLPTFQIPWVDNALFIVMLGLLLLLLVKVFKSLPQSWSNAILVLVFYQAVKDHSSSQYIEKLRVLAK